MATLCVMLDEKNRDWKPPKIVNGLHFVTMHLDNLELDDKEVLDYATSLGMILLSSVREVREATQPESKIIKPTSPIIKLK